MTDTQRAIKYAEALHASTCDATRKAPCPVDGNLAWHIWGEAAVAVADAERSALRAKIADAERRHRKHECEEADPVNDCGCEGEDRCKCSAEWPCIAGEDLRNLLASA